MADFSVLSEYYNNLAKSTKTVLKIGDRVLGLVTGFSIMQDPDVRRIYEIGSLKPRLASGIVPVRFTVSKLVGVTDEGIKTALIDIFNVTPTSSKPVTLSSGAFTTPIDFTVVFLDDAGNAVKTLIIKNCVLAADGLFVNAGDTFIMENLSFEAAAVEEA